MPRRTRFKKPGVFIRGVVRHKINAHLQATLVRLSEQFIKICQAPKDGGNVGVIGDIIAKVGHRRKVKGRYPEGINTEPAQVVQTAHNTRQIADTVTVTVFEAARVNLINDPSLLPGSLALLISSSQYAYCIFHEVFKRLSPCF